MCIPVVGKICIARPSPKGATLEIRLAIQCCRRVLVEGCDVEGRRWGEAGRICALIDSISWRYRVGPMRIETAGPARADEGPSFQAARRS